MRPLAFEFAHRLHELDTFLDSVDAVGICGVWVLLRVDLGEAPAGVRRPPADGHAQPTEPALRGVDQARSRLGHDHAVGAIAALDDIARTREAARFFVDYNVQLQDRH